MTDDPKWQAFLDWSTKWSGWSQERIAEEISTSRSHLNQVLRGKRTGGTTWKRVVKVLPMPGVLLLQQCASWNKFAAEALEKRRAAELEQAKLERMAAKCRGEPAEATK